MTFQSDLHRLKSRLNCIQIIFDFKSFGINLAVGTVVMLVVCAALLLTAAWAINKNKTVPPGPAPVF
ncbi:MAG TPA: hypothetical protein VFB55_10460, partial [Verrucomicrobiae bacterium]|nr:hypothetical protein [Verrucomicrobiae bacterium]